jgi:hypothetical protein
LSGHIDEPTAEAALENVPKHYHVSMRDPSLIFDSSNNCWIDPHLLSAETSSSSTSTPLIPRFSSSPWSIAPYAAPTK